ncbi:MAG: type II toxin-antitoxin system Phd/YefM family antitoxin [Anaerolineae bacterium]|nr:type II toxin-antitoxin system Phd/YefM family antitoxin [Anaerolineae bacterium]
MEKTISATEARIHFGELMRKVNEENQPYIVERSGEPAVVVLSYENYTHIKAGQTEEDWECAIQLAEQSRLRMRHELGDKQLPPLDETIHEMREERDRELDQTLDLRR